MGKNSKNSNLVNSNVEKDYIGLGNPSKLLFQVPNSLIKDNITPFIPKDYKYKQNSNNNQFLENKTNLNMYHIPKNDRKNSLALDNYSTSDEMSPEKQNNKNTNNHRHNQTKKNGNKVPFKGEAKDFKVKYKTELCKFYEIDGKCKFGDKCAYAHGKENLRSKVTNTTAYRTKKCTQFFETGYCPYGNRCQFAHQLKSNIINNPYEEGMSYTKILEIMSKLENVENIKKLVDKPRLPIFEEICKDYNDNNKNEQDKGSRLFNDIKQISKEGIYQRIEAKK